MKFKILKEIEDIGEFDKDPTHNLFVFFLLDDGVHNFFVFSLMFEENSEDEILLVPRYFKQELFKTFLLRIDGVNLFSDFLGLIKKSENMKDLIDELSLEMGVQVELQKINPKLPLLSSLSFQNTKLYNFELNNYSESVEKTINILKRGENTNDI